MAYNIQTISMLIGSISGDDIKIIFNPKLQKLYTGDSIKIIDEKKQGIVAQVYQIENLDISNITDESLKSQIAHFNSISANSFSDDIGSLHLAKCKIKLSIIGNKWVNWRGNLPSMVDIVDVAPPTEIISHTIGTSPLNPIELGSYVSYSPVPLKFEASSLEKTTLIIGDKAKEKANLVNIIQEELVNKKAKVLIIDAKGGYSNLKNAKILEAGKNFKLSLVDYGISTLGSLISGQIEPNFKLKVDNLFMQLANHAQVITKGFTPLKLLRELLDKEISTPEGQKRIAEISTLRSRLISIENLGIFANTPEEISDIGIVFNEANLVILDISTIPLFWQKVFIRSTIKDLTSYDNCVFVLYEDIFKYIDQEMAVELIYKTRNLGINNLFMTNYEDDIPLEIIKQADNLFMFSTDSLEENLKFYNNLRLDKNLLSMLLKRLPENTVLIHGELSNYYPIIVELRDSTSNSSVSKHFGSVKKYISDYGEVIYSYKTASESHISQVMTTPSSDIDQTEDFSDWEATYTQTLPIKGVDEYVPYPTPDVDVDNYAPSTYQQSSYMDKYKNISEEYEEELLINQYDDDEQEYDIDIDANADTDEELITFKDELYQQKQHEDIFQHPSKEHIIHQFPDEEFIPQHMQQKKIQQQSQPDIDQIVHQIPDDEFISPQIQQQMSILQSRQPQQSKEHIAHQFPDEEFVSPQMQQQRIPQQRPPQQSQQPKEHIAHQFPDEEFVSPQMQQQRIPQQRPQQQPQQPKERIAHQFPDEEFVSPQMQQQRIPQQRPQQQPQQPKERIAHQFPDEEAVPPQIQQQRMQQHPSQQQQQYQQSQPDPKPAHKHQSSFLKSDNIPEQVEDIPVYAALSIESDLTDFKEGDKVQHERYGTGIINRIITTGDKQLCSIQFENFGRRLLDPKRGLRILD